MRCSTGIGWRKRGEGGKALELGEPKTSRSRRGLELTPRAAEALRRRKAEQAAERLAVGSIWTRDERWADLVFTSEIGTPINPSIARRSLRKACERAGVPVVVPYGLRHTVATLLAEEGSLDRVAHQLGHTDTRMVERVYQHRPAIISTAADVQRGHYKAAK